MKDDSAHATREPWQHSDARVLEALERKGVAEFARIAVLDLLRTLERNAYSAGAMSVQQPIIKALGLDDRYKVGP